MAGNLLKEALILGSIRAKSPSQKGGLMDRMLYTWPNKQREITRERDTEEEAMDQQ